MNPNEIELRQWCVDAAIRIYECVVKALPQHPGATNNVNIDVVAVAKQIHAYVKDGS